MPTQDITSLTLRWLKKLSLNQINNESSDVSYANMPLCVIDAVFSISVRYESVIKTIDRICEVYKIDKTDRKKEISNSEFLQYLKMHSAQELANNIFKNKQRTSTTNGILKTDAVIQFLEVLTKHNVERLNDINKIINNCNFENEIKKIPGQSSGISLKYFFMLCGEESLIKPDRMIKSFLLRETGIQPNDQKCLEIIQEVSKKLAAFGLNISPGKLDNIIWRYERVYLVEFTKKNKIYNLIDSLMLPEEDTSYRYIGGTQYREAAINRDQRNIYTCKKKNKNYLKIQLSTYYDRGPGDVPYTSKSEPRYFEIKRNALLEIKSNNDISQLEWVRFN